VFKALADPSRRLLLDSLFVQDGQTLGELAARLPEMTRFGAMKHLRLLEQAGLVATRRVGREKLHYLNPVPIKLLHDRWITKFAAPWVGALAALKIELEEEVPAQPRHLFQLYIRTSPERLWQALTDASLTRRYFHAARAESSWQPGAPVAYLIDDEVAVAGTVLVAEPPWRLSQTWAFCRAPALRADPPSRVTWEIALVDAETCRLTLVHDGFASATPTFESVGRGWPAVLSSLKSLLETGTGLAIAS
jgi:uncharacterized protein YndB with AHSA1/START domain/DNA-binding transcriptional ArsR family regulator